MNSEPVKFHQKIRDDFRFHHEIYRNKIHESKNNGTFHYNAAKVAKITILVLAALGLIFAILIFAFRDKGLPGVMVAGESVTGKNKDEICEIAKKKFDEIDIKVRSESNETIPFDIKGLATVNCDKTFESVQKAQDNQFILLQYLPFVQKSVGIGVDLDENLLSSWLASKFPEFIKDNTETTLAFNEDSNQWDIVPGANDGSEINEQPIYDAIYSELLNPNETTVFVEKNAVPNYITDEEAQTAKQYLDARTSLQIKLVYGGVVKYSFTPAEIASFIKITPNKNTKKLDISLDEATIANYINNQVIPNLATSTIAKRVVIDASGAEVFVLQQGRDGLVPKNTESVAGNIITALKNGESLSENLNMERQSFSTERISINESRWVEANLSTMTVSLWNGSQRVWSTNQIAKGKPSTPTITGWFRVYSKVFNTCMPNSPSPIPLCNIHYTTYWGAGGYAFHEAWWLTPEKIGTGISHGCINMYQADAKMVYDFASIGTLVWVHY